MKARDAVTALENDGWVLIRTHGDHKTFKKDGVKDIVTVSGHGRDDITRGNRAIFEGSLVYLYDENECDP